MKIPAKPQIAGINESGNFRIKVLSVMKKEVVRG
jgi:hypothetical protein